MVVFSVAKNFLLNCNGDANLNWKYSCITVDVQNVLQRKTHLVMMQYTLSMKLMTLFTHHSPRCTCIRVWINSTLSSLFCTEEEVRNKFSPPAKIFLFSALTVSTLFSFQDFNIIAGKNYISKMLLHIYVKTKYI